MRITPVRAATGSVGAVLIATGLLIALDPADPTGGGKAAPPRVVPARPPGSTIELTAQGLRIDFAASSDVLIGHWRPAALGGAQLRGDAPAMEEDHEWASYFNIAAGE